MGFLESFGIGFLILTLIALVVSSIGFYKYVYCVYYVWRCQKIGTSTEP